MKAKLLLPILILMASCSGKGELPDAYGNFETDEITLSAENGGQIVELLVNEGDEVKAGDLLAMTDTSNLVLQRNQLLAQKSSVAAQMSTVEAQMAVTDQQIKNLGKDQTRIREMLKEGAATPKQKDDVEGQIALAEKQKLAAATQLASVNKQAAAVEAQVSVLNDKIAKSRIVAPTDGVILQKYAQKGEFAQPGKSICKMGNLQSLVLRVYISGNQLGSVKIGQTVKVQTDYNGAIKSLPGKVEWIASQAEFTPKIIQTREERVKLVYAVKIRVKNDGGLKIGMPGEVVF